MFRTAFLRISVAWLVLALVACSGKQVTNALPFYNTPDFTPVFVSPAVAAKSIHHRIGAFSFTDQQGRPITDKVVEGKVHVANFIFTSCSSICPVMTKHMKLVQQQFGNNPDLVMLSFSVAPWIDSVGRLREYARIHHISSPNWHLLTGPTGAIYQLARQSYFAEEDLGFTRDSTDFLHTEHVLLVDRKKQIRGVYNGTLQLEAEQLIKDIQQLLDE